MSLGICSLANYPIQKPHRFEEIFVWIGCWSELGGLQRMRSVLVFVPLLKTGDVRVWHRTLISLEIMMHIAS